MEINLPRNVKPKNKVAYTNMWGKLIRGVNWQGRKRRPWCT